ncbi:MAG: hypothetical protein ACOYL6_16865 [Bacteriovoracaceae bacterium]
MRNFLIGLLVLGSASAYANDKNDLGTLSNLLLTIQGEKTDCQIKDIKFEDLGSYAVLSFKTNQTNYVVDTQSYGNWSGIKEIEFDITKEVYGFSKGISTPFSENNQQVSLTLIDGKIEGLSLFQYIDTRKHKAYSVQTCTPNH